MPETRSEGGAETREGAEIYFSVLLDPQFPDLGGPWPNQGVGSMKHDDACFLATGFKG